MGDLGPLEARYDFPARFSRLEASVVDGKGGGGGDSAAAAAAAAELEREKEEILLDVADFQREFQVSQESGAKKNIYIYITCRKKCAVKTVLPTLKMCQILFEWLPVKASLLKKKKRPNRNNLYLLYLPLGNTLPPFPLQPPKKAPL